MKAYKKLPKHYIVTKYFSILVVLFACSSCIKENSPKWTEIQMTAINNVTGEPFSDASGHVYWHNLSSFNHKEGDLSLESLVNGSYYFGFKARNFNRDYFFEIEYDSDKYYLNSDDYQGFLTKGESVIKQYKFAEYSQVDILLTNVNCYDQYDKLTYSIFSEYDGQNLYLEQFYNAQASSCLTNFNILDDRIPAGDYWIDWSVVRGNGNDAGIFYFTVQEGVNNTIVLEY